MLLTLYKHSMRHEISTPSGIPYTERTHVVLRLVPFGPPAVPPPASRPAQVLLVGQEEHSGLAATGLTFVFYRQKAN